MRFAASPLLLLVLLVVPLAIAGWLLLERRRARYAVRFTNLELLAAVAERAPAWRRFVPLALAALAFTAAVVALARPEVRRSEQREQASIALVLDVSGSMRADDVRPTRLEAAQAALRRFVERVPARYRVGLITFAAEPFVTAPLTHDRRQVLESLEFGISTGRGTAIGDALARAVEMLQPLATAAAAQRGQEASDPERPISAVLMLSDGAQRGGILQPLEGAARARSYRIPVFTVSLGTADGVLDDGFGFGGGGGGFPVPPDPVTLRRISRATGGESFAIANAERLTAVYEELASRLGRRTAWREAGDLLLLIAALSVLAAVATSMRWVHRLP